MPESVGFYSNIPEHRVRRPRGSIAHFNLHLVTAGTGIVVVDGKEHTLQTGDAFLFFPEQEQHYYSSEEQPWSVRWVHFYGSRGLHDYLIERGFHRTPLWSTKQWSELEQCLDDLLQEAEQYALPRLTQLSSLLYRIICEFVRIAGPLSGHHRVSEQSERITALFAELQQQAHRPFLLAEWAKKANVSPYQFCRLFKQVTDQTPVEFITLCRMQLAKRLLLEHRNWPIKRVAEAVGYEQASYFNRRFLQYERMTPSEYRRLH